MKRLDHRSLRLVLLGKAAAGSALVMGLGAGWFMQSRGIVPRFELRPYEPRFEWTSIDKKHWQAKATTPGEATSLTDAREGNGAGCAPGMVRVKGNYRLETNRVDGFGEIERIQDSACTDWISKDFPARCRTFDRDKIRAGIAALPTKPLDYCMDRFEYPNVRGENPMIVVTFREAESLCKKSQKRLCTESEWTFACEGEDVQPYPYGYTRDTTACVVDRSWRPFKEGALGIRDGQVAREELDRLWQAEPSGSRGGCKSVYGVYDMTGNVDEWTRTVRGSGYASVLKGGYWGPVRARCRPATRAHNEDFVAYQQSFRCCGAADATVPAPPPMASTPAVDGGASTPTDARADGASADGGAARTPLAALSPPEPRGQPAGWDKTEGDELEALKKARIGLACATAPGGANGIAFAGLAMLGVAIAFSARRRSR